MKAFEGRQNDSSLDNIRSLGDDISWENVDSLDNDRVVLCGANSYRQKYYINPDFEHLPEGIKEDLKLLCVTYVEDVGGVLTLGFNKEGSLELTVFNDEGDYLFDEIGSVLKIRQIQQEKQELLEALEIYYRTFFLNEEMV